MKGFLQSTLLSPLDFVEFVSSGWPALPKKAEPTGGETIDEVVGWCHGLNFQGKVFQADHYHVAEITDGVRVTAWNDDPVDFPAGERYARVVDFLFCVAQAKLGGAISTRQTEVVFAEAGSRARMSDAIGRTFQLWSAFVAPTTNVMHGVKVSDKEHLDHRAARTAHGWREWTEGLDPRELDGNGDIKQQRSQGRFPPASGTRTYFVRIQSRASGVHVASDETALELTTDNISSLGEATAANSDELSFLLTTPTDEPDQGTWTTGIFRASFDTTIVDADMEFGLLTLGGSVGHFGRVNAALTSEVDTKQQTQGAITSTGITVVDTGSVTWGGTTQSDRFELMVAQRNSATMGGPQTVNIDITADGFTDGPWPAAGGETVTPSAAVGTWTAPTPTVVLGGVTMTPGAAVGTWTGASPTVVIGGVTVTPGAAVGTWTAAAATLLVVNLLTPSAAVGTWTAPSPTVVVGGVTMTPAAAVGTWTAASPTVTNGITMTPGAAVGTWTAASPVVVVGGVTVTPAAAVGTWTAVSPVVVVGGVTMTPAAAVGTWTAASPVVVVGGVTMTPAAAVGTWTAASPVVVIGSVTMTPAAAVGTWTAASPTVINGITMTPGAAVGTWTAPTPTVVVGGVTMTPAAAVGTWTAPTPTVVVGGVTMTPAAAVGTWTAPTPTVVVGGVTVSPGAAVGTWTAASPTVVVGGVTTTPGAAVGTWTSAAPTVVVGGVTVSPGAAVGTWTAASPIVVVGVTVSPGAAVGLWVSPSPTVIIGGVTVTPAAAVAQWIAASPTVSNVLSLPGRVDRATVTCRVVDKATLTCRVVDSATLTCRPTDSKNV